MAYCTENDLSRLLSSVGLDSFSDNDGDGEKDSDVINDCLEQAAEEIDMRLHERYTSEDLATSSIINRSLTVLDRSEPFEWGPPRSRCLKTLTV